MIRIVIADDHTLVRKGLRRMLEDEEGLSVVAEASTGKELMELVKTSKPDIVLMDISMPDVDGWEATKRLVAKGKPKKLKVIVVTMHADEHYAARLLRMGASGYVVKDAAPQELAEAIHAVQDGRRFVSAGLREALALRFIEGLGEDPVDTLTNREMQVLRHLAAGATNREIAEQLSLSVKTVDVHRLHILDKLGLRNNVELTRFAIQHDLVKS